MSVIDINEVLQINDLNFIVGATQISFQQDNLSYQFKTLRTKTSTKISTGHGGSICTINIQIPREDILVLHRLIVEVNQNPFIYIENRLIRHKFVPHWPKTQNMAFSVLNLHVENVIGNVGLYSLILELQWFNYFPFTHNFLFREEWKTDWLQINSENYENYKNLLSYSEDNTSEDIKYIRKSIFDYIVDKRSTLSAEGTGFKSTFEDYFSSWNGFITDLMPVPSGMTSAFPVNNPATSKIYVRYINELQKQALIDNFNIDVQLLLGFDSYYNDVLSGNKILPKILDDKNHSASIIENMLSNDDFSIYFNIYYFVDLPPSIKEALNDNLNAQIDETIQENAQITEQLSNSDDIPDIIKQNLNPSDYQKLMNCSPLFRPYLFEVLEKLINGDNASGIKYIKGSEYQLYISETIRSINAEYGSSTSFHKIHTPEGKPDSFACDINVNGGSVGNFLDKVSSLKGHEADAIRVQTFHLDYGYIVNKYLSNYLKWGGNFKSSYDANSAQKTPLRISNAVNGLASAVANVVTSRNNLFISGQTSSLLEDNWLGIVYPTGTPGNDPVHIQLVTTMTYKELQEGKRPTSSGNNDYVYNQFSGTYTTSEGKVKPWYKCIDFLKDKEVSLEDQQFFNLIIQLNKEGWKYYNADKSVVGVFYKQIKVNIPADPFNGLADGSSKDLDTILNKISGNIQHIVTTIPINGHEFPTHQHLGSLEPRYNFEFITQERYGNRSGLGPGAQALETARITLQQNARSTRVIHDCWMADIDNFITRLFGTFRPNDLDKVSYDKFSKKTVIHSVNTDTIEGNPGLVSYAIEVEESQPYITEQLIKTNTINSNDYENIYKKIIKKLFNISKRLTPTDDFFNKEKDNSFIKGFLDGSTAIVKETVAPIDPSKLALINNLPYYQLNLDSTEGLNPEEQKQLDNLVRIFSGYTVLSELILFNHKNGGLYKPEIYGLEKYFKPNGYSFFQQENANRTLINKVLEKVIRINSKALDTTTGIVIDSIDNIKSFYKYLDDNTTQFMELIGYDLIDFSDEDTENYNLYTKFGNTIIADSIFAGILVDIYSLTSAANFVFTSGTSDLVASYVDSFFDFDTSVFKTQSEVYGYFSSFLKFLAYNKNISDDKILTTEAYENAKIDLIKSFIKDTLSNIINNPFYVKYFEIEEDVAALFRANTIDEKDTLPDLSLPKHPFFEKTYLTPPDFYYYNFHEDGQYSDQEYLERNYTDQIDSYISSTYDYMKKLKDGEINLSTLTGNIILGEVHGQYDGSDNTASPDFAALNDGRTTDKIKTMGYTSPNEQTGEPDTLSFNKEDNSSKFLVSNFDRTHIYTPQTTSDLISKISSIEAHFGKTEGYANEREEVAKILPGKFKALTSEELAPTSFTHFYGKEDLQQIARESLKDLVSQKFTMKRAWPAFRLYFIEEDQQEDFLIKYDDFYHYSAIKEITIVRSREISGDSAIIVMQNISGILDGSKRLTVSDTDYLYSNRKDSGELTSKGKYIEESRKPKNQETNKEELFTSLVLRPGLNVQLRTGYGNDPNNLEVKLSGRVVDVSFSENSDLVEIFIQGFGVELEQQQKGIIPDSSEVYNLTHKLLGALMFSPELKHFGRFEKGVVAQFGETKDSKVDFKNYEPNSWFYKMKNIYFNNTLEQVSDLWNHDYVDITINPITATKNAITNYGSVTKNTIELGASVIWDTTDYFLKSIVPIKPAIEKILSATKNTFTETTAYALLSPQDDNLFPPNPKDYLFSPNWFLILAKDSQLTWWQVAGKALDTLFFKPKLNYEDLEYIPNNSTIFQIFHEMTLRHPGYVYAALPYGKDFRYTMFFGVPSQRYWSKPAHPLFISRANELRKALGPITNDKAYQKTFTSTSAQTLEDVKNYIKEKGLFSFAYQNTNPIVTQVLGNKATIQQTNPTGNDSMCPSSIDYNNLNRLGVTSVQEALLQYYQALTLRFEPFRRYHMATSDTDIISNNITVSDYSMANAVAVKYYKTGNPEEGREQEDIKLIKIHDAIPDEDIKLKQIDYPNCAGDVLALRYGVGELIYQAKQMYQGTLLLIGNPRIKPWDIVYVIDKYTDLAGPIEVEQIVEKISFENGYYTEIKPNAVVFANEIASFPIMEGLKSIVGALTAQQDKYFSTYKGNDFFHNVITSMGAGLSPTGFIDLNKIFYYGSDGNLLSDRRIEDIAQYAELNIHKKIGLPGLTQYDDSTIGINNSLNTTPLQSVFLSGAWLLGGLIYLNKVSEGQNIIVYPLLKNGLPYIAGIPSGRPETIWSIFRGQIDLFFNDVTKGTSDYISYWKLLGTGALESFTFDSLRNKKTATAVNNLRE